MNARWWGIHACLAWCWGRCTGWMYVYSVSLFVDTNDERWSWYSSILHFIVTNMITINHNRNHPPEPRTWKLMVGSWNVGVSAYFQGRISLAVRGAKMTRPGRRCTRTCPWAETGGSENLSWPVIQLDRKKWDRKNAQKTIKKIQVRMPCQKFFTESSSPSVSGAIHQPQGGQLPAKHPARLMVLSLIHGNRRRPKVTFPPARPRKSLGNSDFGWFCVSSLRRERWVYTWQLMVSKTSFIGSPGLCFKCYMFVLGRVGVGTWQTRTCVFTRFMT